MTIYVILQMDSEDNNGEQADDVDLLSSIADKDDGISCALCVRYPILQAINFWQEPPDHSGWLYIIQYLTCYIIRYI